MPDPKPIYKVLRHSLNPGHVREKLVLWPVSRISPDGWLETGFSGTRTACLHYMRERWRIRLNPRLKSLLGRNLSPSAPSV